MNNPSIYGLPHKYIICSSDEQQQEWQFRGSSFIKSQKSVKQANGKGRQQKGINHEFYEESNKKMKSSSMFLPGKNKQGQKQPVRIKVKDNKHKKPSNLNVTEHHPKGKKTIVHSKINNLNKTVNSAASEESFSLNTSLNTNKKVKNNKNKKRSISRDFLMFNGQIYQCDNIEEVNQKIISGGSDIMSHDRFYKSTFRNISKLQKYFKGFICASSHQSTTMNKLNNMTETQKSKLYQFLKKQRKSVESEANGIIQNLVKKGVDLIQQRANQGIKEQPLMKLQIQKWKNVKMHQLMAIHNYFTSKQYTKYCQISTIETEIQALLQRQNQIFEDELISEVCDSQQEQVIVKNQELPMNEIENNPEFQSSLQDKSPKYLRQEYLIREKYPENIPSSRHQYSIPPHHILSDKGITLFMQRLWDFMVDSNQVEKLIFNLHTIYRPDLYSQPLKNSPIFDNNLFIHFCKFNINHNFYFDDYQAMCTVNEYERYVVIFHKALFDHCQETIVKFQLQYPMGLLTPLSLESTISSYLINEENIISVWDELIKQSHIVNNHHLQEAKFPREIIEVWVKEIEEKQKIFRSHENEKIFKQLGKSIENRLLQEVLIDFLPLF